MPVLRGLWRRSPRTEESSSHCRRNFDSLPGHAGIAAVSSSNSANSVKKLPQGLNYWRLLLRVFWYNWEHRGSLISLSYDLKVKTRACRALSELWACSTQTSKKKKSNSHKTVQGWIAYLHIKDLLSLNHLTHNHINCILKKERQPRMQPSEKHISSVLKSSSSLWMPAWKWNWQIPIRWHRDHTRTHSQSFAKNRTWVFTATSVGKELMPLL